MSSINKIRFLLLTVLSFMVTFAVGQELVLDRNSRTINSSAQDFTFNIISDVEWAIEIDQNWLTVKSNSSSGSGNAKVTLHANENLSPEQRHAIVTVSGGGLEEKLIITQLEFVPLLIVNTTTLRFNPEATTLKFSVTSNVEWDLSVDSGSGWLTVTPQSGSEDGEVTVSATANTGSSPREATITLTSGSLTQTVKVYQNGSGYLTVGTTALRYNPDATTQKFSDRKNVV